MPTKSTDLRRAILDQAGRGSAGKRTRAAPPQDAASDPPPRAAQPEDAATHPPPRAAQPGRHGKVTVTGYFAPEVRRQLKRLAADADTTVQALLGEALNDLFAKHGLAEIADADS